MTASWIQVHVDATGEQRMKRFRRQATIDSVAMNSEAAAEKGIFAWRIDEG